MSELYKKYRPTRLKDVLGQKEAVSILSRHLKNNSLPQCLLLSGGSGVGKTTLCRILKTKLKCDDLDYHEINAASSRGIDTVRDIDSKMCLTPFGPCRIYLLDESHNLTKDAQTALLKVLEDTPRGVYFFLATTNPDQLIRTIRTRCEEIKLKPLSSEMLSTLVLSILEKEKKILSQEVITKIVEASEGSARWALVHLGSVIDLEDEALQLECVSNVDTKRQAFDLVKALLYQKSTWAQVAKIIQEVNLEEPEKFRHFVLACANTELLKANRNSENAFMVLDIFRANWYDCGKVGLTACCFEVVKQRK